MGIDEVDTSNIYGLGKSESNISNFLKKVKFDSNFKISTKVGLSFTKSEGKRAIVEKDSSEKSINETFRSSLERLDLQRTYSLYLHYPDPKIPIDKSINSLLKLKNQNLVEKIGLCNYDNELLDEKSNGILEKIDRYQTKINMISYLINKNFYDRLFKKLRKYEVEIVSYSPLNRGMLVDNIFDNLEKIKSDKLDRRSRLNEFDFDHYEMKKTKEIKKLCETENYPLNVCAVLFLEKFLGINKIILGSTKRKHLEQIYQSNVSISNEFFKKILDL